MSTHRLLYGVVAPEVQDEEEGWVQKPGVVQVLVGWNLLDD